MSNSSQNQNEVHKETELTPVMSTVGSLVAMILEENRQKGHPIEIPSLKIVINGNGNDADSNKETKPPQASS